MAAIVLVGLMGAGKSTVGRLVADRLGRRLVDSDRAIAERTGSSVRELWESGGEAAYRGLESEVVLDALGTEPAVVVAAPGGVVLDPAVRDALRHAFVVWLRADPQTLAARVRPGDHRPLLGSDPTAALTEMAVARAALYHQVADVVLDVDGLAAEHVAASVLALHDHASVAAGPDPDRGH